MASVTSLHFRDASLKARDASLHQDAVLRIVYMNKKIEGRDAAQMQ